MPSPEVRGYEPAVDFEVIFEKPQDVALALTNGEAVSFVVSDNFNIIISRQFHSAIKDMAGLGHDQVLMEGYINPAHGKLRIYPGPHHQRSSGLLAPIAREITEALAGIMH